jgi:hypothetical protein
MSGDRAIASIKPSTIAAIPGGRFGLSSTARTRASNDASVAFSFQRAAGRLTRLAGTSVEVMIVNASKAVETPN